MTKKVTAKKDIQEVVSLKTLSLDIKSLNERMSNLEKKVGKDILASEKRMKAYTQEALDLAFRGFYAVHEKTQDNINLLIEKMDSINVLIYKTDKHNSVLENHGTRIAGIETVITK